MTDVVKIIEMSGGTVEEVGILPDDSGFALGTFPLPKDHWLYRENEEYEVPPMLLRMGTDHPDYKRLHDALDAAVKYALRVSTDNGKVEYDPDAVCQNVAVGLFGYHTPTGLSELDDWANPDPAPPIFKGEKE